MRLALHLPWMASNASLCGRSSMEYIICLKWGGLHGHIALQQAGGEVLYVLRSSVLRSRPFPVVDANGGEVLRVRKASRLLGTNYLIRSAGQTVAEAGSNWLWSHGIVKVAGKPAMRCKYGWGMKSTLILEDGTKSVARIRLERGIGIKAVLFLDDATFDESPFLVACAPIFRDWTSRG